MISTSDALHVKIYLSLEKWIGAHTRKDSRLLNITYNLINLTGFQIILWGVNNRSIRLKFQVHLSLTGFNKKFGLFDLMHILLSKNSLSASLVLSEYSLSAKFS